MKKLIALLALPFLPLSVEAGSRTYQPGYSQEQTCYEYVYREEYIPGTSANPGRVVLTSINCISYMMQAGMTVRKDNYNNIIGRLEGEGSPIVTGSHVDTVETAGKYDGVLGVLAGIEAAEQLKGEIKSPLEVVIFNDEEITMDGSIGYCSDQVDS